MSSKNESIEMAKKEDFSSMSEIVEDRNVEAVKDLSSDKVEDDKKEDVKKEDDKVEDDKKEDDKKEETSDDKKEEIPVVVQSIKAIRDWFFKDSKVDDNTMGSTKNNTIGTQDNTIESQDNTIESQDFVFSLAVETKRGTANIYYREGDDPHVLAKTFGTENKLPKKLIKKLSIMIREKHIEYLEALSASDNNEDNEESSAKSIKVTLRDIVNQAMVPHPEKVRSLKAREISLKFKEKSVLGGADITAFMQKMKIDDGLIDPTRFADWSRDELITVLIDQNVELRGERKMTVKCLQHTCDVFFKDREMPDKPPVFSDEIIDKHNKLVQFVQDKWIEVMSHRRTRKLQNDIIQSKLKSSSKYQTIEYESIDIPMPHRIGTDEEEDLDDIPIESIYVDKSKIQLYKMKKEFEKEALQFLDTPWVAPSWEKAEEYIGYFHPRKGGKGGDEFPVCCGTTTGRHCCTSGIVVNACGSLENSFDIFGEGQLSDFAAYGSGITNYFKTLKWFIWIQFIMCCLGFPSLVLNIHANTYSEKGTMSTLGLTTCGNLEIVYEDTPVEIALPGCSDVTNNASCSLTRDELGQIYCGLDIAICVILILGIIWLRRAEKLEDQILNDNTLDIAMYTVEIKNLPEEISKEDLKAHIDKVLGNSGENEIVEMAFAYAQEEEIVAFTERGDLNKLKSRAINLYRKNVTHVKEGVEEQEVKETKIYQQRQYLAQALKNIDEKRLEIDIKLSEIMSKPLRLLSAFVTFDKISSANKFVSEYNLNLDQWLHYPEHLRLEGKTIDVNHAVDPSLLIWENLQYNVWERTASSGGTFIVAIILIAITVIVTFATKYLQQLAISSAGTALCPSDFSDYTDAAKIAYFEADSGYLHCYCSEISWIDKFSNSYCKSYAYNQLKAASLQYFSSIIVLVINSLMEYTIQAMAEAEHHHSYDTKEMTIFFRVFLLRYINMSCIFLINNVTDILSTLSVSSVDAAALEFSANWYFTVGVTIVLVQIGSIFSSQVNNILDMTFHRLKVNYAKVDSTACLVQDELNELRKGPPFLLSSRYATVLATFFVCFTFSTGMPILYFCAFFNMLVTYFMDKYMFVRICQQPIHLSQDVGRVGTSVLYIALIIHICSAFWTLSNYELFDSSITRSNSVSSLIITGTTSSLSEDSLIYQKIISDGGFPMFCFVMMVVSLRVLLYLIYTSKYLVEKIQFCVEGDFLEKRMFVSLSAQENALKSITFTRAMQRNLIKGLSNYNILANPTYKVRFGSSWDWADSHHNIRSLIKLKVVKDDAHEFKKDSAPRRLSLEQSERNIGNKRRVGQDQHVYNEVEDVELGMSNDEGDLDADTILRIAAQSNYGRKVDQTQKEKALVQRSIEMSSTDNTKQFDAVTSASSQEARLESVKGIKRYKDADF